MNKEEILTALKSVIMQMDPDLPADAIIPAADLRNDLAFDSLDIYELLWHLDKELNLRGAWHENDFSKLEKGVFLQVLSEDFFGILLFIF